MFNGKNETKLWWFVDPWCVVRAWDELDVRETLLLRGLMLAGNAGHQGCPARYHTASDARELLPKLGDSRSAVDAPELRLERMEIQCPRLKSPDSCVTTPLRAGQRSRQAIAEGREAYPLVTLFFPCLCLVMSWPVHPHFCLLKISR